MKERHWNSLVTSLRHGQSVLVLGPELAVDAAEEAAPAGKTTSVIDALTRELASELEDDGRRVTGTTLAAVAQQYEDAQGFGPMRSEPLRRSSTSRAPSEYRTPTTRWPRCRSALS